MYSSDKSNDPYGLRSKNSFDRGDSNQEDSNYSSRFDYSDQMATKTKENEEQTPKNKIESPLKGGQLPYATFLKNKHAAFWFFSQNQKTKLRLNEDDVTKYMQTSKSYDNVLGAIYFGAMAFSFGVDYYLRYSNMLYGITYKWSLGKFLFKYWVIPYIAVFGVGSAVVNPKYKPILDDIVNKYDFNEPLFQQTYEEEGQKKPTNPSTTK